MKFIHKCTSKMDIYSIKLQLRILTTLHIIKKLNLKFSYLLFKNLFAFFKTLSKVNSILDMTLSGEAPFLRSWEVGC